MYSTLQNVGKLRTFDVVVIDSQTDALRRSKLDRKDVFAERPAHRLAGETGQSGTRL